MGPNGPQYDWTDKCTFKIKTHAKKEKEKKKKAMTKIKLIQN